MSSALQAYLEKNYLSKSSSDSLPKKSKKKKKSHSKRIQGLALVDEDADWESNQQRDSYDDIDGKPVVAEDIHEDESINDKFSKANWVTIHEESVEEERRRSRSPSLSVSPRRTRQRSHSPSLSPHRHSRRLDKSRTPSISPARNYRSSRSPAPSPRHERRQRSTSPSLSPPCHRSRSPSVSPSRKMSSSIPKESQPQHDQTIYRDKHGRKVNIAAQKADLAAQRRRQEALEESQMEWGTGLKQKSDAIAAATRLAQEKNASFANYVDDQDRNEELKERDRWGDPMAGQVSKSKRRNARPVDQGPPPPPNRFGISPGYRWDGVNRSNGFEKEFFQARNARSVLKEEAYKWSTENM